MNILNKLVLLILILICFSFDVASTHPLKNCHFDRIYKPGDSISNTGDFVQEVPIGNSTGRCSNGLVMIDNIDCAERYVNGLTVGEVGGNDYNYDIFQGKSMEELRDTVTQVVIAILKNLKKANSVVARMRFVLPGIGPPVAWIIIGA